MIGDRTGLLAALADATSLSDVMRLVSNVEGSAEPASTITFGVSGNVTLDALGTYLKKHALIHGMRADVAVGAFGDNLGNARRFASEGFDAIVFLDLFDARLPALEARVQELDDDQINDLAEGYRAELKLALLEAAGVRHVFVGRPHRLSPPRATGMDPIDALVMRLGEIAQDICRAHKNTHLISMGAISARLGWDRAHSIRSYERFRAPFTPAFLDAFAAETFNVTRGFGSYYLKALVLDGDGTLWGGVLGEDGPTGVKLDPFTYPGSMFWRIQHELLGMQRRGVLLCLCSKNDADQLDEFMVSHPAMVLHDQDFVARRVNWDDKASNLEQIAAELNIGLDSMAFLDDSAFECDGIRRRLPMVTTLQVPSDLSEYPRVVDRLKRLFATDQPSTDGATKTERYRVRAKERAHRDSAVSQQDYLASLGLSVTVRRNDPSAAPRIAELTQKSNQFNVTTRRYTVAEIDQLLASDQADVYTFHVADRHGDAGLTGVLITKITKPGGADTLFVDTFLMSCRVLGRGIEFSFWEVIRQDALRAGVHNLAAEFIPTARNLQVADLWDRLGLTLETEEASGRRTYRVDLESVNFPASKHVEVRRAG